MPIDHKKFKDELSKAFIELLDSKRGVATDLANAVGKTSSFVSQVKRGRPVNSTHLKAVGIVFGAKKVLELLNLQSITNSKNSIGNISIVDKNSKPSENKSRDIISCFDNPETGLQNIEFLITIEEESQALYGKVCDYIKTTHDTVKILKEEQRKKTS